MNATAKTLKSIERNVGRIVTVKRTDGREFLGTLVRTDEGYTVKTGKRGRPATLTVENIESVVPVAA